MLSQMDRFIITLCHQFVQGEADRLGFPKEHLNDRIEVSQWVDDFVRANWAGFQRRVAREGKTLREIFREEWAAFLTRQ